MGTLQLGSMCFRKITWGVGYRCNEGQTCPNSSNWGYTQITIVAAALFGQALIGNRLLDFIPHRYWVILLLANIVIDKFLNFNLMVIMQMYVAYCLPA
ncbi:hypothetical protein SCA6_018354 [Theobroma cacao]